MKHFSPTLLALAAIAPTAAALDVKDDDVKLGLALQIQARAERGWSRDNSGNTFNVAENQANSQPDNADFYLRRLRFGFKGSYQGDYKFACIFRTDNADRSGSATIANGTASGGSAPVTTTNNDPTNRIPQIHEGVIERVFKQDDAGLEHAVRAGLGYAFFNGAQGPGGVCYSSSTFLFPSDRATANAAFLAPRGAGLQYRLSGKAAGMPFIWGADVQNNVGDDSASVTGNTSNVSTTPATHNNAGEGMCYTTRLQFVPFDSDAKGHMKTVESFVGQPGQGVLIGLEYGINLHNNSSATQTQDLKAWGVDVLGHLDGLTALIEWRAAQQHNLNVNGTADQNIGRRAFIVQAAYAMPLGGKWIEPCFRWSRIDMDHDSVETSNYGGNDYGASGFQSELGVNYYMNKHSNKLQLAYQHWRGEQSNSATVDKAADANIVRAQWQLNF